MTLLLEGDPQTAALLVSVVGGNVDVVDSIADLRRKLSDDTDLVLIGPEVDLALATDFAEAERVAHSTLGVVLLRRTVNASVLNKALRAGMREVVVVDDQPAVQEACIRSRRLTLQMRGLHDARAEDGPSGRVVTVFSAKGGCGKTTVSTNLAAAAASGGARRVCLVDLDLAFGDVAIALQLFPSRTIADAVAVGSSLDEAAVRSLITPHSPGLDVVVAPLEPGTAESITAQIISELIAVLRRLYDVVVIDTPPAFTDQVLAAFDASDLYVLLATLDIPALKNLKLTLETLDMLGYPRDKWRVGLNRADSKVGLSQAEVEKTLNAPFVLEIPSSRAVSVSINRGVPLVLDDPNHPVSVAIRTFMTKHVVPASKAPRNLRQDRRGFGRSRKGGTS